jgi:GT2 family glycosyltransferase
MTQPKVSVIIVNWNGLDWLKVCLPSLEQVTYPNLEVIVVDNGSTDGSIEYLEQAKVVTTIIKNATNLGFAYPNNQGIERATGEFVLFLNNDMTYAAGFIEPLVEACQQPGIGAVQPKMVRLKDPQRLDGVGSYLTAYGVLLHYGFGRNASAKQYNVERDIFCPKGAAMMVRHDVLRKVGPFDADYFAYFEETDLSWRIWLAGYRIRYVPTGLVQHAGGETAKRISLFAHYHSFKNRIATLIKNLGLAPLAWMLPLHLALVVLVSSAYLAIGQLHVFAATWKAIWWNIVNLGSTLKKRRHVQRVIRKVSDRDLLPQIIRPLPLNYFKYLFGANLEDWPEPTWLARLDHRN